MALDELQINKLFGRHWSLFEDAHGDVRRGKYRARVFKSKFPVNYRTSSKMQLKFPGIFKRILWNESIDSLWQHRHFFLKTFTTAGAFLSPDRLFLSPFAEMEHWSWIYTHAHIKVFKLLSLLFVSETH
jgi:hypothetical protein